MMQSEIFHINQSLGFKDISMILKKNHQLQLSKESADRIKKCHRYLENKLTQSDALFYGINTGFGSLCNTRIPESELSLLQKNLILSHACGMGDLVPDEIVKLMLLLKIQSLSLGHSGVKLQTVEFLIELFNKNLLPKVFTIGSLGASGDLAPLAHLSLPLIGEGELKIHGSYKPAAEVLAQFHLKPLELGPKEGLALLNGTQFMAAYGTYLCLKAESLLGVSNLVAAMSLEAYDCRLDPFNALVHAVRNQSGQEIVSKQIREILHDSKIIASVNKEVQDPYSFRCIPQVHGASIDIIHHCKSVFNNENNSVTDNPLIFPDEDKIISGGNFHGQPLAIALDMLCIALSELGSISERRIYRMIAGKRNLPPYLTPEPGTNSGFMIVQYTAAALATKSKQLCNPASADSIESSNGQEDHVSMGANAAVKCLQVFENTLSILALELFCSAQAVEIRDSAGMSSATGQLLREFRSDVPFLKSDSFMQPLIEKSRELIAAKVYEG
jgi:histidine ammonia-lyase